MTTLYLLHYNNYYNRIVKREETIEDYAPYVLGTLQNTNFNPNDGVSTEHIFNWEGDTPDYVLAENNDDGSFTRWFVIESERLRGGQYKISLYRDTVADYYEGIVDAPCFIEKATVQSDDPAIYNSEDMGFNQIKTSETLLKDKSGCAWLVGYFARTDGTSYTELSGTVTTAANADYIVNGPLSQFEYYDYLNKDLYMNPTYVRFNIYANIATSSTATPTDTADFYLDAITAEVRGGREGYWMEEKDTNIYFTPSSYPGDQQVRDYLVNKRQDFIDAVAPLANFASSEETSEIMNLNGRVVQYTENGQTKFSRLVLVDQGKYITAGASIQYTSQGSAYTNIRTLLNGIGINTPTSAWGGEACSYSYRANRYRIELQDVDEAEFEYDIDSNRVHVSDAPYDIFAIPYGDVLIKNVDDYDGSTVNIRPSASLMLNVATEIAAQQGSKVYDLQLLPYCPMQSLIDDDGGVDVSSLNRRTAEGPIGYANIYKKSSGTSTTAVGVILLPTVSSFTLNILLDEPITVTEPKVQNLCDMYRLVSPNYSGQFEFSAVKNAGVQWINVDCTYLPYNPYMHLNPDFKNLYGSDFNDSRGLVCTGDYSVSVVTDQWTQYQINNKNYQQIFNRQIQNMEFNNKMGLLNDMVGAAVGTAQGAMAGGIMGGGPGAIAGGAASLAGGIADIAINQAIRNETIDYTKDQFGYQLGNIKALPDSIARTTAFTYNNKIFPILEYYTCTETEKQALRDKCYYNGMTIMRIGTIREFLLTEPSYIKGKLIRMEDISDDFHMLNTIASEVNKGVFI